MLSFLFFILLFGGIIVLAILLSVLNAIFGIFRGIFSFGRNQNNAPSQHTAQSSSKKKIFEKTEGDYVDYEEIKDKK
jgi:hypothetical protein